MNNIVRHVDAFHYWPDPEPEAVGKTVREFLDLLEGPTHIKLSGQQSTRCRAVATLLHGNEPSGLTAIHHLLAQDIKPVMDIHLFILSVDAAKQGPGFIYRMLPHHKDINRCFKPPYDDSDQDQLALALLNKIKSLDPECLIDVHNTSGSSPSFGVTTFMDEKHDALVSLFSHRMIVTDLSLGALMEISDALLPTVTIECGGAEDDEANRVAITGLSRYMTLPDILNQRHGDLTLEFFHHPIRMELTESSAIAYGKTNLLRDGVTLLPSIESYNFGYVTPENQLGFVSGTLKGNLTLRNQDGEQQLHEYFELRDEALFPRRKLKLFMVTTNPEIARNDCLFYVVPAD